MYVSPLDLWVCAVNGVVYACLIHPANTVRIISRNVGVPIVRPYVSAILTEFITLMDELDNQELVTTLELLIDVYVLIAVLLCIVSCV